MISISDKMCLCVIHRLIVRTVYLLRELAYDVVVLLNKGCL
jgi:hypothetical protein